MTGSLCKPGCRCIQVLVHWACAKISAASDMPDEQLRDIVVARLSGHPAVRFATVAAHAQGIGRRGLAALLLEYESCAAEQARLRNACLCHAGVECTSFAYAL